MNPPAARPVDDVRMRGFKKRTTVADARRWVDSRTTSLAAETIPLGRAAGRVLAADVASAVDVPGFDRAMMDGYAICAADSLGATPNNALPLSIVGEILPGEASKFTVEPGRCVRIMTGAPMPAGADAVLPFEQTEVDPENSGQVRLLGEVTPAKHVGRRGEDVATGDAVMHAGRVLRPQDLGVLSSVGCAEIPAVRRPRVQLVVTGNELLPAGSTPQGMQIVDANSPMLTALVERDGGVADFPGIVADEEDVIRNALDCDADVVLVSGGSSVGREDFVPQLLASEGELAVHGVAMRPSSPTGMGRLGHRLVFLLPGNPVSCLCAYDFFAGPAIRALGGRARDWPYRRETAPLARKIVSQIGRVDYCRVKLTNGSVEPLAISGASVLSSTTRADGFVVVPDDSEGFAAGADVDVHLYDGQSSSPAGRGSG